jgi:hypothetical protein
VAKVGGAIGRGGRWGAGRERRRRRRLLSHLGIVQSARGVAQRNPLRGRSRLPGGGGGSITKRRRREDVKTEKVGIKKGGERKKDGKQDEKRVKNGKRMKKGR